MKILDQIGVIGGVPLYEHPELGDEAPIQYMVGGELQDTPFWDMYDPDEIKIWLEEETGQ
tara:strand:+ start:4858 stop:5037 length:180 start_codon:yes stop_codon:yes gene_type:complete